MVEQLNEVQIMEIKEAFLLFDKSGNNVIDSEDLGNAIRVLGYNPTESELKYMIEKVDADGNGTIDFHEFLILAAGMVKDIEIDYKMSLVLNAFDRDAHGFISVSELRHVMNSLNEKLTNEEINEMIQEADLNNNNEINYDKFVKSIFSYHPNT